MRIHSLCALCLAGCLLYSGTGIALEAKDIFKVAEPSVVIVLASDAKGDKNSLGSGVLVAPLEIVTSCKVVEAAADIVVTQGSALRKGRLRFQDAGRDLCQIHIDEPLPSAKVAMPAPATGPLEVGQEVYVVGSPRGLERTLGRAMVTGLRETPGSPGRLIQIDIMSAPGTYGGGLFDQEGRLLGILTPQFRQADAESWVLPATWIAELERRNPDRMAAASAAPPPSVTAPESAQASKVPSWMPKAGDRWKYKLTYGKQLMGTVTIEAMEVSATSIRERVTFDRSRSFEQQRNVEPGFNPVRFQQLVVLPGGYQLAEVNPYVPPDTDLRPGKKWQDIPGEFAIQGSARRTLLSEMKVVGREKLRVPAGTFDAWRVETVSNRIDYNSVFFSIKCIFWHAPEMRRAVRIQIVTESSIAAYSNTETYELAALESAR